MKIYTILVLLFFLLFSQFKLKAQNTEVIGDSIELSIEGYKGGQIQWQQSTDSTNWVDIVGAQKRSISLQILGCTYYRAIITLEKCSFTSKVSSIKAYTYVLTNLMADYPRNRILNFTWTDPSSPDFTGVSISNKNDSSVTFIPKGKQTASFNLNSRFDTTSFIFKPVFTDSQILQKDTLIKISDDYQRFFSQPNHYIAHRGFSAKYPENSILAFSKAAEIGCNYVECDIQRTKDNVLVLCHDDSINRVSNGKGAIADMTYAELLQYNFGYPVAFQNKFNVPIASYEDFLKTCKDNNLYPHIELKIDLTDAQAQKLIDLTLRYLPPYHFCFHSYIYNPLQLIRKYNKKIILEFINSTYTDDNLNYTLLLYPSSYDVSYTDFMSGDNIDLVRLNKLLSACSQNGIFAQFFTIDDKSLADQFISNGVKCIYTNNPLFK